METEKAKAMEPAPEEKAKKDDPMEESSKLNNKASASGKVMDACHFDFTVTDSDFNLPEEKAGKCQKREENKFDEEEETEEEFFEEEEEEEDAGKLAKKKVPLKLDGPNPLYQPPKLTAEEQYYAGLPPEAPKQLRTDYPVGLSLKKECIPKAPGKWKTVDNFQSEPIATFSPVSSQIKLEKDPKAPTRKPEEKSKCQKTARDPPPIVSVSDEVVVTFLEENNVQMLFEYFLGLCILNTPQDPIQFISELTEKLIKGRESDEAFQEIPRLLSSVHLESMFRLYDRVGSGFMSFTQYKNAMGAIGLVKFNQEPEGHLQEEITKETFMTEAKQAVDDLLRSFLFKRTEPKCSN